MLLTCPLRIASAILGIACCIHVSATGNEVAIPEYIQQEVDSALTAFHANRAITDAYAVRIEADFTSMDFKQSSKSQYIQANMIRAVIPGKAPALPMTRSDYNTDALVNGVPQPSIHWWTLLTRDGKRFHNVNREWSEIPHDSKAVIPGKAFDLWNITVCQLGDFSRKKVTESYFDLITQTDRLVDAKIDPMHIVATWLVSPKKNAKVTIVFDRKSKMPVASQWRVKTTTSVNGRDQENWNVVIGDTRSAWKQLGTPARWFPYKVSMMNSSARANHPGGETQWDLELDWMFGKEVDGEWFDPVVAPTGDLLFKLLQL